MKYPLALIPALLAAMPAAAHPGAHLHPHGAEGWLALLFGALALAAAAALAWQRR